MFSLGAPELLILLLGGALLIGIALVIVLPIRLSARRRASSSLAWVQCPRCGATLSAGHQFCGACGARLGAGG